MSPQGGNYFLTNASMDMQEREERRRRRHREEIYEFVVSMMHDTVILAVMLSWLFDHVIR